jgi:hypothetical protein
MGHTYHILHHFRDSIPSPIIVDIHVMAILISFINLIIDLDESVHPSLRNGEAFIGYESRMLFLFTRLLLATFFLPIFLLFVIFIIITLLLARPQNSTHFREVFLELKDRWSHQHFKHEFILPTLTTTCSSSHFRSPPFSWQPEVVQYSYP